MSNIQTEVFTINLTYEIKVNTDTGEILSTTLIKRSVDNSDLKPSKNIIQDESPEPTLYLEENKYRLNTAAIQLMGLNSNSKILIKYEDCGDKIIPVIGTNLAFHVSGGNRLTKSNTVGCRGNNHDELAKYGNIFKIAAHPNKEGLFILIGDTPQSELNGDENIQVDEINLEDLVDDSNVTEIDSTFFKL